MRDFFLGDWSKFNINEAVFAKAQLQNISISGGLLL